VDIRAVPKGTEPLMPGTTGSLNGTDQALSGLYYVMNVINKRFDVRKRVEGSTYSNFHFYANFNGYHLLETKDFLSKRTISNNRKVREGNTCDFFHPHDER
jgi:hypothetical protein